MGKESNRRSITLILSKFKSCTYVDGLTPVYISRRPVIAGVTTTGVGAEIGTATGLGTGIGTGTGIVLVMEKLMVTVTPAIPFTIGVAVTL